VRGAARQEAAVMGFLGKVRNGGGLAPTSTEPVSRRFSEDVEGLGSLPERRSPTRAGTRCT